MGSGEEFGRERNDRERETVEEGAQAFYGYHEEDRTLLTFNGVLQTYRLEG